MCMTLSLAQLTGHEACMRMLNMLSICIPTSHTATALVHTWWAVQVELFAANKRVCTYCGQAILRLEDAQVDHIIPFSKGGMSEALNAQLLHIHCNQKKSNLSLDSPYATAELNE